MILLAAIPFKVPEEKKKTIYVVSLEQGTGYEFITWEIKVALGAREQIAAFGLLCICGTSICDLNSYRYH
jgi:hypothetical protein